SRGGGGPPPPLRPPGALFASRRPGATAPAAGADPPQNAVALPGARVARHARRGGYLRRPRRREAGSALSGAAGPERAAGGARRARRPRPHRCGRPAPQAVRGPRRGRPARGSAGAATRRRLPLAVRSHDLGPPLARRTVRLRLRVGALRAARKAALGLVRPADRLPRPARRAVRAADRPR